MIAFNKYRNGLAALLLSGGLLSGGLAVANHGSATQSAGTPAPSGAVSRATPGVADQSCDQGQDANNEDGSTGEGQNGDRAGSDGEQADGGDETGTDESGPNGEQAADVNTAATPGALTEGADLLPQATISVDQAVQAARSAANGAVGQVELAESDGTLTYDVEIGNQDVVVNASDGSIISVDPRNSESGGTDNCAGSDEAGANATPGTLTEGQDLAGQATLTVQQAIQAAQATATGNLGAVGLEDQNGTLVYTVGIGDQEIAVDATTGVVLPGNQEG